MSELSDPPIAEPQVDQPTLDELLDLVTEENRHDEVSAGPSVGREAW